MTANIEEGEPLAIGLPNRNASIYMSSHFRLDDFPASSEPLSDDPLPHTHLNPAEAFEDAREEDGYRGTPFPRRDFLAAAGPSTLIRTVIWERMPGRP